MALHMTQPNEPDARRGAMNDLAALAWKWEERARAAERTLRGRRAREWGAFLWGLCVGGAVATFGYLAGAL